MTNLGELLNDLLSDVTATLPAIVASIVVIIIGYVTRKFVRCAVNKLIEKKGIEKSFDETDSGK